MTSGYTPASEKPSDDVAVKAHAIDVQLWATETERQVPGKLPAFVRWHCSCGRLGKALPIEGVISGRTREASAHRRASDGGWRHVAAMERGR